MILYRKLSLFAMHFPLTFLDTHSLQPLFPGLGCSGAFHPFSFQRGFGGLAPGTSPSFRYFRTWFPAIHSASVLKYPKRQGQEVSFHALYSSFHLSRRASYSFSLSLDDPSGGGRGFAHGLISDKYSAPQLLPEAL